jgi:hypothetical protein
VDDTIRMRARQTKTLDRRRHSSISNSTMQPRVFRKVSLAGLLLLWYMLLCCMPQGYVLCMQEESNQNAGSHSSCPCSSSEEPRCSHADCLHMSVSDATPEARSGLDLAIDWQEVVTCVSETLPLQETPRCELSDEADHYRLLQGSKRHASIVLIV